MSAGAAPGRLHVLTDQVRQTRHDPAALARMAAAGGADVVQLRDKRERTEAERVATAVAVSQALDSTATALIINDHVELARTIGAAGVHLGREDVSPSRARDLLGRQACIGATAHTLEQARRVAALPVDYLGVGPVFGTASKDDPEPELGLDALARIVSAVERPVIAIGNITAERVASVLATGAYGVAVLGAVVLAADPEEATRRFAAAVAAAVGRGARSAG